MTAVLLIAGCSHRAPAGSESPKLVEDTTLQGLLLTPPDIDSVMGVPMTPQPVSGDMQTDQNILANLNCLGIWQIAEAAIYGEQGKGGWRTLRRQTSRTPDNDQWESLARQAIVAYPSAEAARGFFDQSADRWSNCTNHHVNITLNGKALPRWLSGELRRTDSRLDIPITLTLGGDTRSCQHVLSLVSNVILDVEACTPQTWPVTQAGAIAEKIEATITS